LPNTTVVNSSLYTDTEIVLICIVFYSIFLCLFISLSVCFTVVVCCSLFILCLFLVSSFQSPAHITNISPKMFLKDISSHDWALSMVRNKYNNNNNRWLELPRLPRAMRLSVVGIRSACFSQCEQKIRTWNSE